MSSGNSLRALAALACAAATAACSLPWQQLSLPGTGPQEPPTPPLVTGINSKGGAPLAKTSPDAGRDRVYAGSGQFEGNPEPRPISSGGDNRDAITLNLADASIAEAAKSILGDTLGLNYVVSDKLKGSITIQTTKPVPKDALLEIFESMLRSEGAAIVVENNLYRIVPSADALASAPLRARGVNHRRMPGVSARVIPLRYVAAAEMERILKSISPQVSLLRVDSDRNLLVVSGTRGDLDAILDAVNVFDVDWMRGMSFAIYPIETGDPEAIAQELDTVFANDRDSPTKGVVRFVPNRRLKSILVITSRAEYLRKAETWLQRIDMVSRATVKQVHVYHILNRPAVELANLLQKIYGGQDRVTITPPVRPPTAPAFAPPTVVAVPGLVTPVVPVVPAPAPQPPPDTDPDPATAPPAAAPATPATPPGVPDDRAAGISVVADESNNALIVTATAAEYKRVRHILERIDIAANQVLLEATIAEVHLNDDLKMGVRWFFQMGNHQLKLTDNSAGAVAPVFPGFSSFFSTPNVGVVLNALSQVTDLNVISSPTLMVLDNKRAVLQVGNEVPIATQSAVSVITPGAPIVNSITYRSTGIVLNITPRIGDRGRILLDIEQEASDVVATSTSKIDSPTIQQRRIKTTVAVNDGEGIVLGGMMQDRASNARDQVPLAGELPLFGNLFKNKVDTIERTELLVAITPRIVKDALQIRAITDEFRDKINLTTRPQRQAPPDRKEKIDRIIR